jgi:cytoskeletal protein RodZ
MSTEQLRNEDQAQLDPNVEAEDEELSSGNNRLALIIGGLLLLLIVGYVLLPKGNSSGSGLTPSFMLDDAAVTGSVPAAEAPSTAPSAAEATTTTSAKPAATTAATTTAPASTTTAPAAAPAAAPAPAEVVAPAAAPVEVAEPAAPSTVTLGGRILDENGRPLVGATVLLRGSSKGTSTDANGNYSLDVPNGENTLVYGYGGYDDEEVKTRGNQPVNVTLTPNANAGKKRRR